MFTNAASGKRIMKPSDDVPGTNRALSLRSSINTVNQFADNVTVSKRLVDATEGDTVDVAQVIHRIRGLAIEAAKDDCTSGALMITSRMPNLSLASMNQ
jgi:flagellin-like hook-associated protein FlgL